MNYIAILYKLIPRSLLFRREGEFKPTQLVKFPLSSKERGQG
jgi:hypothetical protein